MFHNKSPTKHFGDTPVYVWMFTMCRYKKKNIKYLFYNAKFVFKDYDRSFCS